MLAKNHRLPGSGHTTPSPPGSPRRSPRYRHSRSKPSARFPAAVQPSRTLAHRVSWIILTALLRRQGVFLFAPLIYISCMLLYMGTVSFDVGPIIRHRSPPGSVYKSPQLYAKLRHDMDADNSSADAVSVFVSPHWPLGCELVKAVPLLTLARMYIERRTISSDLSKLIVTTTVGLECYFGYVAVLRACYMV